MMFAEVRIMCVRSDVCRMMIKCPCDQTSSGWDIMMPKDIDVAKHEVLRITFKWER